MRSEATNEIDENLYYVKNIISPYLDGQGRVAAGVKYAFEVQEFGKDKFSVPGVDSEIVDSYLFLTMIESSNENVEVIHEPIPAVAKLRYEAESEFKRISAVVEELQLQETHKISKRPSQESGNKEQEEPVQERVSIV